MPSRRRADGQDLLVAGAIQLAFANTSVIAATAIDVALGIHGPQRRPLALGFITFFALFGTFVFHRNGPLAERSCLFVSNFIVMVAIAFGGNPTLVSLED